MNKEPVGLIVASFTNEADMEAALKILKKEETVVIHGVVGIYKDDNGNIHHKDVGMTPGKGAVAGLVLGATLGVLTGGTALALGALGSIIGGILGKKKEDKHVPVELYNWEAAKLKPGDTAVLVVFDPQGTAVLVADLEAVSSEVLTAVLSADLLQQLAQHKETAYTMLTDTLGKQ
ncbi:MAG: DUF1269 domain-containing protein [Chloroflexi bacterium]|nr:DUF1269 domain-containing protein [Chloroflexota bacterium]